MKKNSTWLSASTASALGLPYWPNSRTTLKEWINSVDGDARVNELKAQLLVLAPELNLLVDKGAV